MAYFTLQLRPPRTTFPGDMTEIEREAMGRHAVYLREQMAQGVALAFGPVMDPAGAWGLALIETENAEQAAALAAGDPVVKAGLGFSYDILPMASLVLRPNA